MNTKKADMLFPVSENVLSSYTGEKLYEMSNHLGNVLTVINDIKVPYQNDEDILYYATIVSTTDYSPFGVTLDTDGGRTQYLNLNENKYRFRFQGQEMDDEIKGDGNSVNYMYRMHDPRVGRFFKIDPLADKYPWQSTYAFAANNPISYIEVLGLGPGDPVTYRVQKDDNLTKISKKFGVSIADLKEMNKIENINKIQIGQVLIVNPEATFSHNPRGGYRNPNNSVGQEITIDNISDVGFNFVVGKGFENSIIIGGSGLESVKHWSEVQKRLSGMLIELYAGGKFTPGEATFRSFKAENLPTYLQKGLEEAWEKIKEGKNPWSDNSLNTPIHVLGSFTISLRINADGTTATVCVYDSKSISSLSDNNLGGENNRSRSGSNTYLTNTYQRYIWNIDLFTVFGIRFL